MIINNTFSFIFVHVPRAAGTTISKLLQSHSSYRDIELGGTALGEAIQPHFLKRYGLGKHSTAREIRAVVGDDLWERYFTFAFVRNPYSRAFSLFNFMKAYYAKAGIAAYAEIEKFGTFSEFVRSDYFESEGPDRILRPQLFWLRHGEAGNKLAVDYVGRVESMAESVAAIAKGIGNGIRSLDGQEEMPRLNESADQRVERWQDAVADPEVEEIIYQKFAVDFRVFGYPRAKRK